ncbi:MAG: NAD(+)/NADH kinase [Agathobacter sp.]|nr:NAD(+)/NADH kinase [Agathobacter sp.]
MKNFVLITNVYKDKNLKLSNEIVSYIKEHGGKGKILLSNVENETGDEFETKDIPDDTECILVLGGDGTLIRAATKVEALQIPLIGINLGTLGYLCELEETTVYDAIDKLMADSYMMEHRLMLTGYKAGCEKKSEVALNDIVIHRVGDLQILSLKVYVNDELLSTYHADGIIVATPTGSTGYSMSAGGPIIDPNGKLLLLTPNNAHNLNSKSIVLDANDTIEIEIASRRSQKDEKACVSFDGDSKFELSVGDRFVITKALNYTKICKLKKRSFLEILRKKMETYT